MDETPYSFSAQPVEIRYDFESVSDNRTVKKVVRLNETILLNIFNLALLDILDDGLESDLSVSNNDDLRTVLATVMQIISSFLTKFPEKIVTFRGSDERRTRLYRIVIGRELAAIQERFQVFGQLRNSHIEQFEANRDYEQFYIGLNI
jgi:hypothetical protein